MFLFPLLLIASLMMPGTSGMKPTSVHNHDYATNGLNDIESMTEVTWDTVRKMTVKQKLKVKSTTSELPISVYHDMYRYAMSLRQSMTRIASVAVFWTPTSSKFNEMASLIVVDKRFEDEGIKDARKDFLTSGKLSIDLIGSVITVVPFDPNFQQFITGSLDFATATLDINKIRFYISFPDTRMSKTSSTAGFIEMSWKTVADNNGVYESVNWDVFTFEKRLPAEIALMQGRNNFERVKNYLDRKYNDRKNDIKRLNEVSNALIYGSDQGLNKMKNRLSEEASSSQTLVRDSSRRIKAIEFTTKHDEISTAKAKLVEVMSGSDIDKIRAAKNNLVEILIKHNIEVPEEYKGEDGYVIIGDSQ